MRGFWGWKPPPPASEPSEEQRQGGGGAEGRDAGGFSPLAWRSRGPGAWEAPEGDPGPCPGLSGPGRGSGTLGTGPLWKTAAFPSSPPPQRLPPLHAPFISLCLTRLHRQPTLSPSFIPSRLHHWGFVWGFLLVCFSSPSISLWFLSILLATFLPPPIPLPRPIFLGSISHSFLVLAAGVPCPRGPLQGP